MHENPVIKEMRSSESIPWISKKKDASTFSSKQHYNSRSKFFRKIKDRLYTFFVFTIYPLVDLITINLSLLLVFLFYKFLAPGRISLSEAHLIPLGILNSLTILFLFKEFGAYRKETSVLNAAEIERVIKGISSSFLLVSVLALLTGYSQYFYLIFIFYVICQVLIVMERTALYHLLGFNKTIKKLKRKVLIFGAGQLGQKLYRSLTDSPKLGINPIGFLDSHKRNLGKVIYPSGYNCENGVSILGTLEDLSHLKNKYQIDEIYITENNLDPSKLAKVISFFSGQKIRVIHVPDVHQIFTKKTRLSRIGQLPLVEEHNRSRILYSILKAIMDTFLSIILISMMLPLFALIAIVIKLDTPGPVIFKHTRVGKGGTHFRMYKFRTMFSDVAANSPCPKQKDDSRITKAGFILRKLSLDELPQLINVLKGNMSLIGPRPEMPFIVKTYDKIQTRRLKVKPGITGLWQLSGDRSKEIHENIYYDLYYIHNQSIALDLAILIETFIFSFRGI